MAFFITRRTVTPLARRHIGHIEGVENIPRQGPFLLAANHISYIEPSLLAMLAVERTGQRVWSLTKFSIWKTFSSFGMAGWLGMIPVEPSNSHRCLETALAHLVDGDPVLIFPEGTRNTSAELLEGKTGVARLALRTGVPVVPIGYQGPPGATTSQSIWNFLRRGKEIVISVGTPLVFPKKEERLLTHEELRIATATIMRSIAHLSHRPYAY